jgi:hypothetical protein
VLAVTVNMVMGVPRRPGFTRTRKCRLPAILAPSDV